MALSTRLVQVGHAAYLKIFPLDLAHKKDLLQQPLSHLVIMAVVADQEKSIQSSAKLWCVSMIHSIQNKSRFLKVVMLKGTRLLWHHPDLVLPLRLLHDANHIVLDCFGFNLCPPLDKILISNSSVMLPLLSTQVIQSMV